MLHDSVVFYAILRSPATVLAHMAPKGKADAKAAALAKAKAPQGKRSCSERTVIPIEKPSSDPIAETDALRALSLRPAEEWQGVQVRAKPISSGSCWKSAACPSSPLGFRKAGR